MIRKKSIRYETLYMYADSVYLSVLCLKKNNSQDISNIVNDREKTPEYIEDILWREKFCCFKHFTCSRCR